MLPKSDFADSFREHVGPRLESMIGVLGHFIGVGLCEFSEAYHDIVHYAVRHGAGTLPDRHFDALTDWIGAELSDVAADTEAACGQ
jgi:hypothetical protein